MPSGSHSSGSALSNEQAAYLVDSGAFTPEELTATQARLTRGELAAAEHRTRLDAIEASLGVTEAAALLGVTVETVRERQQDGALFAFEASGYLHYPTWQFTSDPTEPLLPGISEVVRALPRNMQPASILGFMTTPQVDACINGVPQTPVEWLQRGGNPAILTSILDSYLMS